MPKFRATGGQTGRMTEKAGMESGRRDMAEKVNWIQKKVYELQKLIYLCYFKIKSKKSVGFDV